MTDGLHHFHKRKRIHQNLEPYPHPDKWISFLDKLVYFIGIFTPIITVPQIIEIWVNHNASGVSLISWAGYFVASVFWFAYGITHKEKPIIFSSALLALANFLVVLGIIFFG